jgi:hypothetical protein
MALINPAILWGLLLVSVPVILHFLLRSKPKKLFFPALRLVRIRRQNNIRRLRLKHLWLLLLRMAVLGFLVMAIARPTLPAANYNLTAGEWARTAAIAAVVIGVYWWFAKVWKKQSLPNHVYTYRRSLLRTGSCVAAFLACLAAVAFPYGKRIAAEISSPLPSSSQNLPVAAVFIFDSSLSMSYRQANLTRLEMAERIAEEHLQRLPSGSRVAVTDSSTEMPLIFQAEQSGALDRIQKLQPRPVSRPLADRIRAALALQEDDIRRTLSGQASVPEDRRRDHFLREIYLFTDLTATGWRSGDLAGVKAELERLPAIALYIIDVGTEKATNVAINGLRLSSQSVPKGSDLTIDATVDVIGTEEEAERTVELHVQNESGTLVKPEQRTLKPTVGRPAATSFTVGRLSRPITHGELRLVSSDPYSPDDVRYFTVAVTPPLEVLVVGESRRETFLLEQALAPAEFVRLGRARYNVKHLPATKLKDADFKGVDVVCLVNVGAPSPAAWSALADFVRSGGGLFVVAGNERIERDSYNANLPQSFLPASLTAKVTLPAPATLDLRGFQHPILKKFEFLDGGFGELATVNVYRRWGAEPAKESAVIAAYTDPSGSPALLERSFGRGRTILLTTALDRKGWSDLASLQTGFRFLVLADQIVHFLSRQADATYNYTAGDDVAIPLTLDSPLTGYFLRKPGGEQIPGDIPAGTKEIVIRNVDQIGPFEVVSRDEHLHFSTGFSVNASAAESDFTRMTPEELDNHLGKGRYSVARSVEGLTRNVAVGRVGQEVFSLILGMVIAIFCAEHFVANRFYEGAQATEHS